MDTQERQRVAEQIDALERNLDEVRQAALKPVAEQLASISERIDALRDRLGTESFGQCVGCDKHLFEGDRAYHYTDEIACEDCAPTWADIKYMLENDADGFEPDRIDATRRAVAAHQASGTLGQKVLTVL